MSYTTCYGEPGGRSDIIMVGEGGFTPMAVGRGQAQGLLIQSVSGFGHGRFALNRRWIGGTDCQGYSFEVSCPWTFCNACGLPSCVGLKMQHYPGRQVGLIGCSSVTRAIVSLIQTWSS